jgi:hypothetical protein
MAGGSTAPTEITDGTSHINPTYDSDEDGQVEAADDADNLGGSPPSNYTTPSSTQNASTGGGYTTIHSGVTGSSDLNVDTTADEIRFKRNSGYGTATIHFQAGGSTQTPNMDSGTYFSETFGYQGIDRISWVTNSGNFDVQVHRPGVANHSHDI